ncbi:phage integrase [Afipia carboxidovorans OM5]|uniref:Integrase n=1 Tax=Afipia carboxidovorans (strain ATCC 49405 / DSM 1227 / KCTC 32145 / OM5) TaxID=504832 RepID=B6JBQ0_AFIC5|nr:phage integrase [Afipia carboxidovorans OM5]AEI07666.1 hypothetical protein OCA5_c29780 [Afipia carboxidovorans OM5]
MHEIMAVTGHQSLKEVERYTKEAQRRRLASTAMAKLVPARPKSERILSPLEKSRDNSEEKGE